MTILLSGPAGGVSGALWVAEQCGVCDFLTFDMGGTSTDVALVCGRAPRIGRDTTIGDLTVRSASVDVRTVGAGGVVYVASMVFIFRERFLAWLTEYGHSYTYARLPHSR